MQGLGENLQELHTHILGKPLSLAIPCSLLVHLGSLPAHLLFWDNSALRLEVMLSEVAEEEAGCEVLYFQV